MERWCKSKYFILIIILGLAGCSEQKTVEPADSLTLNVDGKVFSSSGYEDINPAAAVVDAYVDLYKINNDGTLSKLTNSSVKTNNEGKFHIESEIEEGGDYLVQASKGNQTWRSVVNIIPGDEMTFYAAPLTTESTSEAQVYIESLKRNKDLNYYDISLLVNKELAAEISSNGSLTKETTDLVDAAVNARTTALMTQYFGADNSQLENFNKQIEAGQEKFARDLYHAGSLNAVKNIIDGYNESMMDALINSGLSSEKYIKILEIYFRALWKSDTQNDELKYIMVKNAAYIKARIVNKDFLSKLQGMNRNLKIKDVKNASDQMLASLKSADNYDKIKSAFGKYHAIVKQVLVRGAGINNTLISNIDQIITDGISRLRSDLNSAVTDEQVVQAFIRFYSTVLADIKVLLKSMYAQDSDTIAEILVEGYMNF